MVDVDLMVDNQKLKAREGDNLLSVCLENKIYIPHLCHLAGEKAPAAGCRLCFVEIEGLAAPVTACTQSITAQMQVRTDTAAVRGLQRTALRLLLSAHPIDCKNCHANRVCGLQTIARFLKIGLRPNPLLPIERSTQVDTSHPLIDLYPHRCVLCGKCVRVCRRQQLHPQFSLSGRGMGTKIHHYPTHAAATTLCRDCRLCINVCPVGALQWREDRHWGED